MVEASNLLYISARLSIMVEVFLAFRAMPEDAYETPDWTWFWLHV